MMLTQSYTNKHIDIIYRLRMLFYNFIYTMENIGFVIESLRQRLDLFSISYIPDARSINIKLKKSCMKKIPNYEHTTEFYYNYFIDIFRSLYLSFTEVLKEHYLNLYHEPLDNIEYYLTYNTSMFFNITIINDNIIVINL